MAADNEVLIAYTRSGRIVDSVPFTNWSWSDSVDWEDTGKMSVTVPLTGKNAAARNTVETLRSIKRAPWTLSLVLMQDGRAMYAGPAISAPWNATEITVGCTSISALFDRRMVISPDYLDRPWRVEADVKLALGSRDLVLELLARGMTGRRRDLPLMLPPQRGTTGEEVVYLGYDLKTVYEAVKDATERDDGPDVVIRPVVSLRDRQLRWVADVGDPRLGSSTPAATVDSVSAAQSLSGDIDGSEAVDTGYVLGDGSGSDRLIGVAIVDRGDPHPALERADRTSVSETRQEQLDSKARAYVDQYQDGTESWAVDLHGDAQPRFGTEWGLGDVLRLRIDNHPWQPDGNFLRRAVGVDAKPDTLTLHSTDPAP